MLKTNFSSSANTGPIPLPNTGINGAAERNHALQAYGLDALEDDPELAKIVNFASRLCNVPIALVSLVEEERQRYEQEGQRHEHKAQLEIERCV